MPFINNYSKLISLQKILTSTLSSKAEATAPFDLRTFLNSIYAHHIQKTLTASSASAREATEATEAPEKTAWIKFIVHTLGAKAPALTKENAPELARFISSMSSLFFYLIDPSIFTDLTSTDTETRERAHKFSANQLEKISETLTSICTHDTFDLASANRICHALIIFTASAESTIDAAQAKFIKALISSKSKENFKLLDLVSSYTNEEIARKLDTTLGTSTERPTTALQKQLFLAALFEVFCLEITYFNKTTPPDDKTLLAFTAHMNELTSNILDAIKPETINALITWLYAYNPARREECIEALSKLNPEITLLAAQRWSKQPSPLQTFLSVLTPTEMLSPTGISTSEAYAGTGAAYVAPPLTLTPFAHDKSFVLTATPAGVGATHAAPSPESALFSDPYSSFTPNKINYAQLAKIISLEPATFEEWCDTLAEYNPEIFRQFAEGALEAEGTEIKRKMGTLRGAILPEQIPGADFYNHLRALHHYSSTSESNIQRAKIILAHLHTLNPAITHSLSGTAAASPTSLEYYLKALAPLLFPKTAFNSKQLELFHAFISLSPDADILDVETSEATRLTLLAATRPDFTATILHSLMTTLIPPAKIPDHATTTELYKSAHQRAAIILFAADKAASLARRMKPPITLPETWISPLLQIVTVSGNPILTTSPTPDITPHSSVLTPTSAQLDTLFCGLMLTFHNLTPAKVDKLLEIFCNQEMIKALFPRGTSPKIITKTVQAWLEFMKQNPKLTVSAYKRWLETPRETISAKGMFPTATSDDKTLELRLKQVIALIQNNNRLRLEGGLIAIGFAAITNLILVIIRLYTKPDDDIKIEDAINDTLLGLFMAAAMLYTYYQNSTLLEARYTLSRLTGLLAPNASFFIPFLSIPAVATLLTNLLFNYYLLPRYKADKSDFNAYTAIAVLLLSRMADGSLTGAGVGALTFLIRNILPTLYHSVTSAPGTEMEEPMLASDSLAVAVAPPGAGAGTSDRAEADTTPPNAGAGIAPPAPGPAIASARWQSTYGLSNADLVFDDAP